MRIKVKNRKTALCESEYAKLQKATLDAIPKEESNRLFSYDYCEIEPDFIAFLENYADLATKLPEDYTIIDIGCYQALQGILFRKHKKYIGVEPNVPIEWRLQQDNAEYYEQTGQQFIASTLERLIAQGLDLQKAFVICSAVPDKELQKMVCKRFPNYRVAYPSEKTREKGV